MGQQAGRTISCVRTDSHGARRELLLLVSRAVEWGPSRERTEALLWTAVETSGDWALGLSLGVPPGARRD